MAWRDRAKISWQIRSEKSNLWFHCDLVLTKVWPSANPKLSSAKCFHRHSLLGASQAQGCTQFTDKETKIQDNLPKNQKASKYWDSHSGLSASRAPAFLPTKFPVLSPGIYECLQFLAPCWAPTDKEWRENWLPVSSFWSEKNVTLALHKFFTCRHGFGEKKKKIELNEAGLCREEEQGVERLKELRGSRKL